MNKGLLKKKIAEAALSVLPLAALVFAAHAALSLFFGSGMPESMLVKAAIGAVLLLAGLTALAYGEELAMVYMGELIGSHLTSMGKYLLLVICSFLMGALVTLAEPNLHIFASLVPGLEDKTLVFAAAAGAGVFMVLAVMRVQRRIPVPIALTSAYGLLFAVAAFAPASSLASAFDSGGVATGPVTVAFIMSVGVGLASVRGGRSSAEDSFGAVSMCAVGPVLALLIISIFRRGTAAESAVHTAEEAGALASVIKEIPELFWEAGAALLPILIFFAVFQLVFLKIHSRGIRRIGFGVIYTIIGHTLFLTGVFTGFLPAGEYLGGAIAALPGNYKLILIPAAMLIGGLAVTAEPGVHMLRHQVEEVTVGAINKETITAVAVISAAAASGLAMLRILTGISIWYFLIGGYAVSLVLSFFVPRMFTAIAFDSGIMISGSMTVAFLLPFAKGAGGVLASSAEALLTDAFGLVALVVTAPMMAIQLLGLVYKLKLSGSPLLVRAETDEVRVIEFDKEGSI